MKWAREPSVKRAAMGKPEEIMLTKKREDPPGMQEVFDLVQRPSFFPFLDFFIKVSAFDGKENKKCPWIEGSIGNCALLSLNH